MLSQRVERDRVPLASRQEYVAAQLRAAILGREIPPGTRLRQAEIAAEFNMSITPVREALRILTAEGLVETDTFSGWWVRTPSRNDLLDIYRIRMAICPLVIADSMASRTTDELDEAQRLLDTMDRCTDLGEWVPLNRQFHHTLESAVPGRLLGDLQERLSGLSQMCVSLAVGLQEVKHRAAQQDHRALLEAYRKRDIRAATLIERRHLKAALRSALDAIDQSGGS